MRGSITDEQRVRLAELLEELIAGSMQGEVTDREMALGIGMVLHAARICTGLSCTELEQTLIPLTRERMAS